MPTLAVNRKARFDYHILETYEAGLSLLGHEVKAAKQGKLSLKGAYVIIRQEEAWLLNAHIAPYQPKNTPESYEPARTRRLLLHKKEIKSLIGRTKERGLTLVPLRAYTKQGKVKLAVGLARGKKNFDKREAIKKRESQKKIARALKRG